MPIDTSVAVGARLPDRRFSWTESDVLLYHLGIGAGGRTGDNTDPVALRYTLDDDRLQVLPSFGVVAPTFHRTDPPAVDLPGCDIDLQMVLHGSQEIIAHRPLPTSGTATLKTRISDVWDKGKAAVIVQEGEAFSEAGDLLYRLCGDRNPLHADPAFAKVAGFPTPILHGLCSYGIVLREVTDLLLGGDAARVGGFSARFAGVVLPGETIAVRAWDERDRIVVSAFITSEDEQRDGSPVLADCVLTKA